ncbi:MAG: hypothetical protein AAGI01_15495 [Myxococcota bacterium]
MILILPWETTFPDVASLLDRLSLEVTALTPCVFPARDEPKSATWSDPDGLSIARFVYDPEFELRFLEIMAPRPDFADEVRAWMSRHVGVFPDIDALSRALHADDHPKEQRAAAALRALARDQDTDRRAAQDALARALTAGGRIGRLAAARQLSIDPLHVPDAVLERAATDDEDLDVRLHARRALTMLRSRL